MKKKIAILLTIIMMFVMVSGCSPKSSTTVKKNIKILLSISDASDKFRGLLASNAKSYADSQNVDLTVMDAAGSIETQVSHIKEAFSRKYDAIICAPVDPNTALELEKDAEGIPIIFMNAMPSDDLLEKDKYVYVASDEKVAGQYQAEYIADYFKNKSDIKVVLMKGEKKHPAAEERSKAVKDTFEKKGINAEYVFEDYANWTSQEAKNMFDVFLSTGRKFDCVIANNDNMALGVIDSLKAHNIDPSAVPIIGIDATPDGCKVVADGSMKLTVYQSAKDQGKNAVDAASQLGSGGTISSVKNATKDGKYIWVPFEKVTKDNVSKYMN